MKEYVIFVPALNKIIINISAQKGFSPPPHFAGTT